MNKRLEDNWLFDNTIGDEVLHEEFHFLRMKNGMTAMVYEMPDKSSVSAQINVKFGSLMKTYAADGSIKKLPAGTAHFMEHKMFDTASGDNFDYFAELGANANAYTSHTKTAYLFSTTTEPLKSLKTLIKSVTEPYFTEETVNKEIPIIDEEINMYQDDPAWRMELELFKLLYKNIGLNEDIAGTHEEIRKITPKILYETYFDFYRPDNMLLTVAGNIKTEDVIGILNENIHFDTRIQSRPVLLPVIREPDEVIGHFHEMEMDVSEDMFCFGYKQKPLILCSKYRTEVLLDIILELICGESTELYQELYNSGLINEEFNFNYYYGNGYLCIYFEGESPDCRLVADKIKNRIASLKTSGFDPERFEEQRRTAFGSEICTLDNVSAVCSNMAESYYKNCDLFAIIHSIASLGIDEAEELLRNMFDESNSAISIIKASKGK